MNLNKNKKNFIQASGELFTAVQSSSVLKDSKTFVDSIPRNEPKLILGIIVWSKMLFKLTMLEKLIYQKTEP